MKRLIITAISLLGVIALTATLSVPALALTLPEILPTSASPRSATGKNEGAVSLSTSSSTIECEAATGEGVQEAGKSSGTFHTKFTGCQSLGVKCTGEGDAAGTVLVLGRLDLVFDGKTELPVAVLLSPETVHIICSALVLLEMKGTELCLALKATEKSFNHSDHCVQEGGKATDKRYFNSAGAEVAVKFECSTNHAAFSECAELGLAVATTKEEEFADV